MLRIDARGRPCPWPIVAAGRHLAGSTPALPFELLSDDPAFPSDVAAFTRARGLRLVVLEAEGSPPHHRAVIDVGAVDDVAGPVV